jgi:hypothetical protein
MRRAFNTDFNRSRLALGIEFSQVCEQKHELSSHTPNKRVSWQGTDVNEIHKKTKVAFSNTVRHNLNFSHLIYGKPDPNKTYCHILATRYLITKCSDGYSADEIKEFPLLATGFTGINKPDQLLRTQITDHSPCGTQCRHDFTVRYVK